MALFGEKCPICHMKVEKEKSLHSFGEYFCPEEHVNQYIKQIEKERKGGKWTSTRHGCS